jgi:diguanylate cyclase (GGDEF)-like protein
MLDAVALMADVLGTPYCVVARDGGDGYLIPEASASAGPLQRAPSDDGSMAGYAMRHQVPVLCADLATETRFGWSPPIRHSGLRRGMAVPVRRRGDLSYAVAAFRVESEPPFTEEDLLFLEAVAHTLARAIDRADLERAIRHQALHDPLTGLANRAFLGAHPEQALGAAAREGGNVSLLLLDVDRFKLVNDALGHTAGDELLCQVAGRLRAIVRDDDVAARLGGDEFVIACPRIARPRDVVMLAQRLVDAFAQPFTAGTREWHLGASIGVARSVRGTTAEELLRDADLAMYRAKDRGGSRFEVFDDRRPRHRRARRLRGARPLAPPGARAGRPGGLHPDRRGHRPHPPDRPLGAAVGLCAARRLQRAGAGPDPARAGQPLTAPDHAGAGRGRRDGDRRDGIDASQLGLEITERLLIEEPSASAILEEVRALGVSVALDDFGTGYSSLSYPVDVLKLDRSLAADVEELVVGDGALA